MADSELFYATIPELSARIQKKEISAVELVRTFALRLERLGPRLNALALPLTEIAIRRARDVDKELKRGRTRGPLQGIPYGAKDLLSFAGQPTTWGARPYASQVFDYTATAIQKLDATGSVLVGKLAMVELAGGPSYRSAGASMTGPCLNPWDRSRWAGGSSSGSAAAVAAGLVPFALGSETSGSILTPAAFCGLTGLRPTYGLVSRYGAMALSWTLDKIGPLCRTAEDCAVVLQVISGGDSKDPGSAGKSFYYTPKFSRKMSELRIGFAAVDFEDWPEPEAQPAFKQALNVFREMGANLVEAKLPDLPYVPVLWNIMASEAASIFEPLIESGKVDQLADPKQIAGLKAGLDIPAREYLRAMRLRRVMREEIQKMFSQVDLFLAPSRLGVAPKVSDPLDRNATPSRTLPKTSGFTALIPAANLCGMPALSLPCGFAGNLPVAVQVVGLPFSENTLVAVGKEYQSRTDWHKRHPAEG